MTIQLLALGMISDGSRKFKLVIKYAAQLGSKLTLIPAGKLSVLIAPRLLPKRSQKGTIAKVSSDSLGIPLPSAILAAILPRKTLILS